MDSHKDTLAVSGVDAAGRQQQAQVVPNTRQGHCRLLGWLPSQFLSARAEAERAFQLAERLGSVRDGRNALVRWAVLFEG